jgi:peptidoglycan-N-acetylglucosamine deacetylase
MDLPHMKYRKSPVFSDQMGKRGPMINFIIAMIFLLLVAGGIAVLVGVLFSPELKHPAPSDRVSAQNVDATGSLRTRSIETPLRPGRDRQPPPGAADSLRVAFMSTNDAGGFASLRRNAAMIDAVFLNGLALARVGSGVGIDSRDLSEDVVAWLRHNASATDVYLHLTSSLTIAEISAALGNPRSRAELVGQIAGHLEERKLTGVVVDLPGLPPSTVRSQVAFLAQLAAALGPLRRKLILSASPAGERDVLKTLAPFVDYVVLATHDRTLMREGIGSPSGQGWFEESVADAAALVPREKLIPMIGAFAYDFDVTGNKRLVSVQRAWDLAAQHGVDPTFDLTALNTRFNYVSKNDRQHQVWALDAASMFNHARAALSSGVGGLALYRLGLEDPSVWALFGRGRVPDEAALARSSYVEPGSGAYEHVTGAAIAVVPGHEGQRDLILDRALGLVTAQRFMELPGSGRIRSWEAVDPMAVAITFDDGPDPRFTELILDVLAEHDVKGTFYVLGRNALAWPEILRRTYEEGHDIANHSFSHANLFASGRERIAAEMNATQSVLETHLGIRALLMRPPFASTSYRYLDYSTVLTQTMAELGYVYGGIEVDGFDYFATAEQIHERVTSQVRDGRGQVILLHDSGGSRRATIEALPMIIEDLRADGYHFVTTHELIGLERADLMPIVAATQTAAVAQAGLRRATFWLAAGFAVTLPTVAIGAAILGILRLLLIIIAVLTRRGPVWRAQGSGSGAIPPRSVAVLVPAYNEEAVITKTIDGLLTSAAGDAFEIVIIDDGSTDRTSAVVRETYADDPRVRLLTKANGGKAAALNHGLAYTKAEIVVAIDGDTVLSNDAIERLVAPFDDPQVGAVAGKVVVGNRSNLITRFQALEYAVGQNLDRRAFERFNAIGVVPGAIGAWRRGAVLAAGGYSHDTLAEDADLTLSLQRAGWRVVSVPEAIAYTEAPETLRSFIKQRFRWTFGTLQVAYKHKGALLRRPSGVSMITLPNIVFFQFGFTLLAPVMDFLLVLSILLVLSSYFLGSGGTPADLIPLAQFWLLFQTVDVLAASFGVAPDRDRSLWRLVPLVIVQRFTYRQIMYWVALRALLAALKGTFVGWGKLARTGSVVLPFQTRS